ncbi:phosphoenolpyruvate synthase [Pseudonocardia sulfidoxydans NBRC 16205]|uniref:Rifampicin phosphotransferase n=1 Tax=Pseudonocardia sulfidoxydans NBRC 16205 TaxID=1223511 RepID=A0A511DDB7_9PSEU|nr:rifamycin-inactivating phosphotransferase [Pseudonocardia sulfidoxydans]GEL22363.1 phosphoenolpyruvate synthase [Pseudonocardia sulfidoxydans NBRC 16205]
MDSAHDTYVLAFEEIDATGGAVVGGKAANLGELSRVEGVDVPPGYAVTTHAFARVLAGAPALDALLDRLADLDPADRDTIAALSAQVRAGIEAQPIPDDVAVALTRPLARLGESTPVAVRSSATAEDLPTASFAGQQDTYLNVVGPEEVLRHIRSCWASLFTERAVTYRLRNGIDHRRVRMAVVVQQMVFPQASGVVFTADPVTSDRTVVSVEAVPGLGEALVSGLVDTDVWTVRDDEVVGSAIAAKKIVLVAAPDGGTRQHEVEPGHQDEPTLTDAQVLQLARLGRRIEAHFDRPQDIEWCLADGDIRIVQSRPITTLFPIPPVTDDANHVYVSVGHQQMMTDAMTPLGLSVWQLTTPRPMAEAGGRLFVDVTGHLGVRSTRDWLLDTMTTSDPLMGDALRTVLDREGFLPPPTQGAGGPPLVGAFDPIDADPALVEELIAESRASLAAVAAEIGRHHGADLFDFVLDDFGELRRLLFDRRSHQVFMTAMDAARWINDRMREWLGEENAADALTRSVPHNVTSEMGLALLDVADAVRPHPAVVAYLRDAGDDVLEGLRSVAGGQQVHDAIRAYLDAYGMRCVGEIDISRPRWSEQPALLVPVLLGNVDNFEPGAGRRLFEQGERGAAQAERDLLDRLRALPDGGQKAAETTRMIARLRTFIGYREYPKFAMVCRYFVYKRAILAEADRLVRDGVLADREDAFHLRFQELHEVVRTGRADADLVRRRREDQAVFRTLTPPRVLTSDGEAVAGAYRREDLPTGALPGLAVSAGTVEGRARVVLDMADADLDAGDILVTAYTDPSWSPLFVTIAGLVTEVGGLMTHGAVVAREYGLPAVVGVQDATGLIRDGQRIRVDGTNGYVEILGDS